MTTKEMLETISEKTGFSQKDIKTVIDTMTDVVVDRVKVCEDVKITNGITFYGVEAPAHIGRNPRTGENIDIPAKVHIKAKFGAKVKKAIN